MDINEVLQKVYETLPPQPSLKFKITKQQTGLFDSKIGGIPYFPKNMEYPAGKVKSFTGKPLVLLAQLNFSQLPHIQDFPTKGILQVFIAADDLYGMPAEYGEGLTKQNNFRIIYHEDIITDESQLMTADDMPDYSDDDECYLPFSGEYLLTAEEPDEMPPSMHDFRFEELFINAYNELYDDSAEEIYDILDDEEAENLYHMNDSAFAYIGGYPIFSQRDPREYDDIADCDTVLFELDSVFGCEEAKDINIMWGDVGTGCFLIPRSNLKNLDFSRVVYNYDCG